MNTIQQAMLLAAGRGERMRPITDQTPKPLLLVKGEPLLIHHLYKLAISGFERVIINLGWLGEQIPETIEPRRHQAPLDRLEVIYSQEPPGALETAGGIRHALDYFGGESFVLISSDVMSDLDYAWFRTQRPSSMAHLLLVNNPAHHPHGDFFLHHGTVMPQGAETTPQNSLTYAGIGIFSPELFASLPLGRRPLRPVLDEAIEAGQVSGHHFRGHWLDIGDQARWQLAQTLEWTTLPA